MAQLNRLFIEEDYNGVREYAVFDADDNLIGVEHECDVEGLVELNKRSQTDGSKGWSKEREMRHYASIPPIFIMKWATEKGVSMEVMNSREGLDNIIMKIVKDPDYRHFRIDV